MNTTFYKSLDHPFELFGLKGAWVKMFLYIAGGGILLAIIAGSVVGTGFGVLLAIIVCGGGFFFCLTRQAAIPQRRLAKKRLSATTEALVRRRDTLSRLLLIPEEVDKPQN